MKTLKLKCPSCLSSKTLSETEVPKEGPMSPRWPWCERHYLPLLLTKVVVA